MINRKIAAFGLCSVIAVTAVSYSLKNKTENINQIQDEPSSQVGYEIVQQDIIKDLELEELTDDAVPSYNAFTQQMQNSYPDCGGRYYGYLGCQQEGNVKYYYFTLILSNGSGAENMGTYKVNSKTFEISKEDNKNV